MTIAPIAGPLMGGQIIRYSQWPVIFWFLAVVGALMFISLLWLPETLPAEKRVTASLRQIMGKYRALLQNKNFMRFTLCVTFYYVAAYAFIVGSPAVYISYFGIDPQHYGWLFAINILGLVTVSTVNKRLVQKVRLETLLKSASFIAALMTFVMCFVLETHPAALAGLVICIFIFFSMNGVIAASATAAALDAVPNATGSASALIGSLQYGSGIVSSLLLAGLNNGTPWIMVSIMTVFTLLSFLSTLGGGKAQPKMAEI